MFLIVLLLISQLHITPSAGYAQVITKGLAARGWYPYMAALFREGSYRCAASIVSKYYIITAGHCLYQHDVSIMNVVVGALEVMFYRGILYNVTEAHLHPQYEDISGDYDVGIVKVKEPLTLGVNGVNSIGLSDVTVDYPDNKTGIVTGYCLNIGGHYQVGPLKFAQIFLWNRNFCNCIIDPDLKKNMICGGDYLGEATVCPGDSGAPLVIDDKLYGVESLGFSCGTPHPSIFAIVPHFRSWIRQKTGI